MLNYKYGKQIYHWSGSNEMHGERRRESGAGRGKTAKRPRAALKSFRCTNYFTANTFAARKTRSYLTCRSPCQGQRRKSWRRLQRKRSRAGRLTFRAASSRRLPQFLRRARRRRNVSRQIPQDAHPRRSAVLRKVLFHARRSRFSQFRYQVCAHRRANLLGPVVSGGVANRRSRRRPGDFLSDEYRLASARKPQFGAAQLDAWRTIQRGHAIANGVYAAVVNRVGFEGKPEKGDPGLEFWGNSFVADPFARLFPKLPTTVKKSSWSNATPQRARKRAATGRFSATAASTLINHPEPLAGQRIIFSCSIDSGFLLYDLCVLGDLCVKFFFQ